MPRARDVCAARALCVGACGLCATRPRAPIRCSSGLSCAGRLSSVAFGGVGYVLVGGDAEGACSFLAQFAVLALQCLDATFQFVHHGSVGSLHALHLFALCLAHGDEFSAHHAILHIVDIGYRAYRVSCNNLFG